VESSYLQKLDLNLNVKKKYPLALINLMTRYGEDLIWSNKITKAETLLKFIVTVTEGRSDASEWRKGKVIVTFLFFFFCFVFFVIVVVFVVFRFFSFAR